MSDNNLCIGVLNSNGIIYNYKDLWLVQLYKEIEDGEAIQLDERATDYKYDFLENANIDSDIGFIPHCDRPEWNEI
jgi:hypothetical protein